MLNSIERMYEYVREGIRKGNAGTLFPNEFDVLINGVLLDHARQLAKQVEGDQRHMDDLRILRVGPTVLANTGTDASEQEVFQLPYVPQPVAGQSHGYLQLLNAGFAVKYLVNGIPTPAPCRRPSMGGWSIGRPERADQRYLDDRNPFWRPTPDEPCWRLEGNALKVRCGEGFFADQVRIEYLRHPVRISYADDPRVEPELPVEVNQAVCDKAIVAYLENVGSPRFTTKVQERQINS